MTDYLRVFEGKISGMISAKTHTGNSHFACAGIPAYSCNYLVEHRLIVPNVIAHPVCRMQVLIVPAVCVNAVRAKNLDETTLKKPLRRLDQTKILCLVVPPLCTGEVNDGIVNALDDLFTRSFASFKPNGKRKLIALDISASMRPSYYSANHESPIKLAAAMAYIMKKAEPNADVFAFHHECLYLPDALFENSLDAFINAMEHNLGGATYAHNVIKAAIRVATTPQEKLPVSSDMYEEIVFLTDSEDNGKEQTWELLELYRGRHVPYCKFATIAFAPNNFSLANPKDPLSMDFCGFDSAGFKVMYDFLNN